MDNIYRGLTEKERTTLSLNGCTCDDWKNVMVSEGFVADRVHGSRFTGTVRIGSLEGTITDSDGQSRDCGIRNATVADCSIGNNCLISGVGYISNYDVADGVVIENTSKIVCGSTSFGNGTVVRVLNEAGGRSIRIYEELSAQIAYIVTMYRYRADLISGLEKLTDSHISGKQGHRGRIGERTVISGCGKITDVAVGPGAILDGATELRNGTVSGPGTTICAGVVLHDFIVGRESKVSGGVVAERCFIGEACTVENNFIATDCLFFSNSCLGCGEAVSVFGGPFTVSHHKSSLLIAGYFLFFNAGSGVNQSNHLFKTGPVHQGIHERGCKFGSNVYVMLPLRDGAYNVVIGRHTDHHDTSDFPFSYLVSEDERSFLHPGANLRSFGLLRDLAKWPERDARPEPSLDILNFDEFNPYIGGKLLKAVRLCGEILGSKDAEIYTYKRLRIRKTLLERGLRLYKTALDATVGAILEQGETTGGIRSSEWYDIAGMYAPAERIKNLHGLISKGEINSIKDLDSHFGEIHSNYLPDSYLWALDALEQIIGRKPTPDDIEEAKKKGGAAAAELDMMRREDASKDASALMMTGYGVDSDAIEDILADFGNVHGTRSNNIQV